MKLSQFKFKLPEEKIALHPTKYRDESRLLVLHRKTGEIEHKMFKDVLDYFDDKDVFIFNDTKVFPARLYGNKEKTCGGLQGCGMYWWILPVKYVSAISSTSVTTTLWWLRLSTTPLRVGVRFVSFTTVRTMSSRRRSMRWAKRRCPTVSSTVP